MNRHIEKTAATIVALAVAITLSACGQKTEQEAKQEPAVKAPTAATTLPRTASAEGASVFFVSPGDGATVSNPISVVFGIEGMNVVKAGNAQANSGHHHLLIDTSLPDLGLPIPSDANHIHFGDGSIKTEITLEPGEHTLQMLLGDHLHIPHNPPLVSEIITITVQ